MSQQGGHIVPYRTFVFVWLALLVLTGATVAVSRVHLGALNVWVALGIASVKAGLVIFIFMHLQYEKPILKFFLFIALVVLAIFIGLTFTDVLYR
ncbi:MAG: cytochrome C oxidase subunit IV family protein [Desulfuromonadales bacterium]|jgi:cytochrome c oxidase subunit 4